MSRLAVSMALVACTRRHRTRSEVGVRSGREVVSVSGDPRCTTCVVPWALTGSPRPLVSVMRVVLRPMATSNVRPRHRTACKVTPGSWLVRLGSSPTECGFQRMPL